MKANPKPRGINVLGLFICIGGIMDAYNFLWVPSDPGNVSFYSRAWLGWFNFYISLPVALLSFVVAYGFFMGSGWGRPLGIMSSLLGISICCVNLLGRASDPIIFAIIGINAITIYYLTRPHVRKYFREPRG